MGVYYGRLPQEFTTGGSVSVYHESLPWGFEAYFEVLHPLWIVDNLRTLKVHHYCTHIICPATE